MSLQQITLYNYSVAAEIIPVNTKNIPTPASSTHLWGYISQLLVPPVYPSPSPQGHYQSIHLLVCVLGIAHVQLHLTLLDLLRLTWDHFSSALRSCWMESLPSGVTIKPLNFMLFANWVSFQPSCPCPQKSSQK